MHLEVPYVKQITNWSCAIATMEMVARFHGCTKFDQSAIYQKLKKPVPGLKGHWCVHNDALMDEARNLGFDAGYILVNYASIPEMMSTLRYHMETLGEPLIATQRASMQLLTGHSRLVVGIEDITAEGDGPFVFVHDPSNTYQQGVPPGGSYRKWKAADFARMWSPKGQIVTGGVAIWIRKRQPEADASNQPDAPEPR